MKKKITVSTSNIENNRLQLKATESIEGLIPAGQILVDSDSFSFIYLMEDQSDYTYIVLPENIWPDLKEALRENIPVFICYHEKQFELSNFTDELEYITSNIKGNSNYGDDMVAKVEEIF